MRLTDPRLLSIRALNELRILHPPTYVALRYLLDSSVVSSESGWLHQTLPWKYVSRVEPRFWPVLRFKRFTAGGQIDYRAFLIPSPTTALTEAMVLDQMGWSSAFSKPTFVYSYRWPFLPRHSYSFEHFIMGYKERARAISEALKQTPTDVAVVADIEKFYPSINQRTVLARFHDAVGKSGMEVSIKETAFTLAQHVFVGFPGEVGMAVGPLSLILRALGLRQNLLERVRKRFDRGIPSTGMKRRWAIQELRYAVNRLAYLLPRERFSELARTTEGTPELIETDVFLRSVGRGEFEELLRFPGPSVAAAAAFLRRDGRTIEITRELAKEEIHSAALFSLYGVCSLGANVLSALGHEQREYLQFCRGVPSDKRVANDFSYLDEIRSLQLGRQAFDRLRMLDTRFADEELTPFEALYIGEYYGI